MIDRTHIVSKAGILMAMMLPEKLQGKNSVSYP